MFVIKFNFEWITLVLQLNKKFQELQKTHFGYKRTKYEKFILRPIFA